MIRASLLKSVLDALEAHPLLEREDFHIEEYNNKEGEPCLRIRYRYNLSFQFYFHIPDGKRPKDKEHTWPGYYFNCSMSPGKESVTENITADERSGLITEIKGWLQRLYEDVVAVPVVRQFEAHSSAIEQLRERLDGLSNEPISRDEVVNFRSGLDQIKAELTDTLRREIEDKEVLKGKVEELGRDIDFLKQALESFTKRQWGQIFMARVQKWKDKFSLKQIAAGTRVMKALLPAEMAEQAEAAATVLDGIAEAIKESPKNGA